MKKKKKKHMWWLNILITKKEVSNELENKYSITKVIQNRNANISDHIKTYSNSLVFEQTYKPFYFSILRLAKIKIRILWSDRQDGNGDNHRDICKMMSGSGGNSVFFALWKYLTVEVSDKGLENI